MSLKNPNLNLDKIGACASTLCAIHCLLTGAAMGLLAVLGLGFLGNPWVEISFFSVALLVGGLAVFHGKKRHHSWIPALVFLAGIACIVLSHLVGHDHDAGAHGTPLGTTLAVAGGLLIAAFHFVNRRMQHLRCGCSLSHD